MASPRRRPLRLGPDGRIARIPTPTGFPVGDINSYLILPEKDAGGPVLVDSGVHTDEAWEALEDGLAALGTAVGEIRLLLLTHAHPDHFGQAARIVRESGCPVWSHGAAPRAIERYAFEAPPERQAVLTRFLVRLGVPPRRAREAFGPAGGRAAVEYVEVDRLLEDGERIDLGREVPGFGGSFELEVIHTPGHCPDLVCYWHAASGAIFAGDHLLPDITPVCLIDVPATADGERVATLAQFHESLDKVEGLPVELVLPSHGDVLPTHRRLIADYRLHTGKRLLKIARILAEGELTPYALGRTMFPAVYDSQLHLVLSEVMGHLDILTRDGHAKVEERDGVLHYAFVSLPEPA
ncbi:MAG: MBL fold metallo-hydrolase [Myxococcota bacterium]